MNHFLYWFPFDQIILKIMNSEIYVEIGEYLWNDEISSLFAFCKDEPDLIHFKTYLAVRIITRSISYMCQIRYQEWQARFNPFYYSYNPDDYYDDLAQEFSRNARY